ncbi:MAG: polysaccharide deacetylase [Phycisphaerales bacterium]|nr:polysaccharide deacetylase [Phycisphaerales bacterium]
MVGKIPGDLGNYVPYAPEPVRYGPGVHRPGIGEAHVLVMDSKKLSLGRRSIRRLRNLLATKAVVLCYHQVATVDSDPCRIAVPARLLEEHLQAIRGVGRPIALSELVSGLREGRVPHRAVAVTFDDGHAEMLHTVKPLLERYDIPATAFLINDALGQTHEFWWDQLARALLGPGRVPQTLSLSIGGRRFDRDLGEAAEYGAEQWERDRGWHMDDAQIPGPRQALFKELHPLLGGLSIHEREPVLEQLRRWAGAPNDVRPGYGVLTREEAARLAEGGLVDIGGHTVTHPMLPPLSPAQHQSEIAGGKAALEGLIGRTISQFAYPYGWHSDETIWAVKEAGFLGASSLIPVPLRRGWDAYRIPRLCAGPWTGDQLSQRLRAWFAGR